MTRYNPDNHTKQSIYCIHLQRIPSEQLAVNITKDVEYYTPPEALHSVSFLPSKDHKTEVFMYINFYSPDIALKCVEHIKAQPYFSSGVTLEERVYDAAKFKHKAKNYLKTNQHSNEKQYQHQYPHPKCQQNNSLKEDSCRPVDLYFEVEQELPLLHTFIYYLAKKHFLKSCESQFNCKITRILNENNNMGLAQEKRAHCNQQILLIKGKKSDTFEAIELLKQWEKSFIIIPVDIEADFRFKSFFIKELEALQIIFEKQEKILLDTRDARHKLEECKQSQNNVLIKIKVFSIDEAAAKETAVAFENGLIMRCTEAHYITENKAEKIGQAINDGTLSNVGHYYVNLTTDLDENRKKCSVVVFALDYFKNELKQGLDDCNIKTAHENYSFPQVFADILFNCNNYKDFVKEISDALGIEFQSPKSANDNYLFIGDLPNIEKLKSEMKMFERNFLMKCDQISIELNMPIETLQRDAKYIQMEKDILRDNLIKIYLENEFPVNIDTEIISISLEMNQINPDIYCSDVTNSPSFSWQKNDGNFHSYDAANMKLLQKAYKLNANGDAVIHQGGNIYSVDFKANQQKNVSTGKVRNIKILQASSQASSITAADLPQSINSDNYECRAFGCTWYFVDHQNKWAQYDQQSCDILNESYLNNQKGSVIIALNNYTYKINFSNMTQKNCETKKVRKIQVDREGLDVKIDLWSTATCQNLILFGPKDQLQLSKDKLILLIADFTTTRNIDIYDIPKSMMFSMIDELKKKYSYIKFYIIDGNSSNKCLYTIKIHGFSNEVNEAQQKISDKIIKFLQDTSQNSASQIFPTHWDPMPPKTIVHLVNISCKSREWQEISEKFNRTCSKKIVEIQRIQNTWLWKKYQFSKDQLKQKYEGRNIELNEKHVFHGTSQTDPTLVYSGEEAFDMRFCERGLWGIANYFAVNATYSSEYAYTSSDKRKQMLFVRIFVGDVVELKPDKQLRFPPTKKTEGLFSNERYDTVCGTTKGFKVYMLYANERAYPEYLITIRK